MIPTLTTLHGESETALGHWVRVTLKLDDNRTVQHATCEALDFPLLRESAEHVMTWAVGKTRNQLLDSTVASIQKDWNVMSDLEKDHATLALQAIGHALLTLRN